MVAFVAVGIGQGLVFLHGGVAVKAAGPQFSLVAQPQLAVEVDIGGNVGAVVKIAVVIVVGYLVEIHTAAKGTAELVLVVPIDFAAGIVLAELVCGQHGQADVALIFGLQITELTGQLQTTAAIKLGRKREVVVRGEVEIIGGSDFHTVGTGFKSGH